MATDAGKDDTQTTDAKLASVSPSSRSGEYVVVARRYRPQSFEDLVGQGTVSRALCNALTTDRVGHAYLFTGARGVGKTSTARILAKSLNCVSGPTTTPCDECDICQQIAAGSDVDVLEIDGASNRGIDEIRQLRSNVGIRPSRARFKVYIIDEVHMLTKEAFNALLKTLEEPPDHVKFVFCTTEPGKIPVTVLSRCQRFDFAPVMTAQIVERLSFIVSQEGAEAEQAALELLARRAAGSMRDSQSLLEQLLSFVSEPITVDHVHAMLGTARDERLQTILAAVNARDAAGALAGLDLALREGVDAGQLGEQLVGSLRDMMAALVGCSADLLLQHAPSQLAELRAAAETWGLSGLLAAVQILDQALARMRQSVHGRVLLEVALVRISQLENLQILADLVTQIQAGRTDSLPAPSHTVGVPGPPNSAIASRDVAAQQESPTVASGAKKKIVGLERNAAATTPAEPSVSVPSDVAANAREPSSSRGSGDQRVAEDARLASQDPHGRQDASDRSRVDSDLSGGGGAPFAKREGLADTSVPVETGERALTVESTIRGGAVREVALSVDEVQADHSPDAVAKSGFAAEELPAKELPAKEFAAEGNAEQDPDHERESDLGRAGASWSDGDCERIWKSALNELNDMTADYAGTASGVASSGPNRLVVRFQQMYNSSKSFCERPERRQLLEQAVSRIAGKTVRLDFELTQGDAPHIAAPVSAVSRQQQRQQVTRHPFVERALELFAGEVMQVDVKNQQAKE